MSEKQLPTIETLHKLLVCDAITGDLTWKERTPEMFNGKRRECMCKTWNTKYAEQPAFIRIVNGYKCGTIFNKGYRTSRVVFAMTNGHWPKQQVDHEDQNKLNNSPDNLRDIDQFENMKNGPLQRNNKSGHTGVSWNKNAHKWVAYIRHGGKRLQLGYFHKKSDAIAAREKANVKYGYHENHGRVPTPVRRR